MGFEVVTEFEKKVAEFFGVPYAVATDSCTSGIELCLRFVKANYISVPHHTYLSVPMLANKLGIELRWRDEDWKDYYQVYTDGYVAIHDAAVAWEKDFYLNHTTESRESHFVCVSFQHQKHLSVGRLGVILTSDREAAVQLKKMSYDGRLPGIPWREQDIDMFGYHYYAQIELCKLALQKLPEAIATEPRKWSIYDWPNLKQMKVFK